MRNENPPIYRSADRPGFADAGLLYTFITDRNFSPIEHSHDFYEILFLFSGTIDHHVGGKNIVMHSGDIYLMRPGDIHLPVRSSARLRACMFSVLPEVILPLISAYGISEFLQEQENGILLNMNAQQQEEILFSLRQMSFLSREQKSDEIRLIIGQVCQRILSSQREARFDWLDNLLRAVNTPEKLAEGVVALQQAANLSHAQLCRVFEKQLGQTPQQFVIALRMSYAYEAICSTDEPFERIASSVGYASISHFSKVFKAVYGVTPSALRKSTLKYW